MRARGQLELRPRTWGGRRPGAGRPPAKGRRAVPHRRRAPHDARCPVHVTLRARRGLPSLRGGRVFGAVRAALGAASRAGFRVLQFSVQADHVHLIIEADGGRQGLARALQGLAIRVAKAVNRILDRAGRVWGDRYHARLLRTPREVRHALVYVLQNWRKHFVAVRGFDPRSSAAWFTGWKPAVGQVPILPAPVAAPRTWMAAVGWRLHGLIGADEAPALPGDRRVPRRRRGIPARRPP